MKTVALALSLLAVTPATAQTAAPPPPPRPEPLGDVARFLADPDAQNIVALQIASLAGIVLDTRIGAIAGLADPRDHIRANDTLRTLEHRRDPAFERHLYEHSRRAVATVGMVAGGMATTAAELRRTSDRLRAALGPLIDAARTSTAGE